MPIKPPSLGFLTTRKPAPRSQRWVSCPTCGRGFEVSSRAISATCPTCTRHFVFDDVSIRKDTKRDVSTMGHVHVEPGSGMIGRVVCGSLTIEGRYDGDATVFGAALLVEDADCRGVVRARSLSVPAGTTFYGKAHIGSMRDDDPETFGVLPGGSVEPHQREAIRTVIPTRLRRTKILKAVGAGDS
ncbi:polymer-forming cytoskeletal protein [Mucisphaera calidilacus]|uniref:BacA-like protein n=1 Tax=Mucisphaera calidilacus TaxID=2527982 RepID=A0A518BY98_9BACT|nr:polymer-forming cytoskeletal protein [Mucisphaera calidilacus]QDU71951.1 BacA-like protein [Mucisphaera calidilacus]